MNKPHTQSQFCSPLSVVALDEESTTARQLWRLTKPLRYWSNTMGWIIVPEGYITDLASVPRVPLAYWLAGGLANRPAVVHDWLCEKLYSVRRITWRQAADILLEAMEAEGVAPWRRWLIHKAVLVHGRYLDLGKCR